VRPTRWLWSDRLALGTLALLGGREGIGKSLAAYTLAADVTWGRLPGKFHGTPKSVVVSATEDSWSQTIVPRLMAAGADLGRVFRVDVATVDGAHAELSLPADIDALAEQVPAHDVVLILLDPLMSRVSTSLDTHKDADVRIALEPVTRLAEATGATVLGVIHVNKSGSTDPLTMLMGSRAFAAVARAVLFVLADPDDDGTRLLGQPKNNLGRTDLPSLKFRIISAIVAVVDGQPVSTGKVVWEGESARTIADVLADSAESGESRMTVAEAVQWLTGL
jgi:predicted ATP-dependent serine protease